MKVYLSKQGFFLVVLRNGSITNIYICLLGVADLNSQKKPGRFFFLFL